MSYHVSVILIGLPFLILGYLSQDMWLSLENHLFPGNQRNSRLSPEVQLRLNIEAWYQLYLKLLRLFTDRGVTIHMPILVFSESKSAIQLAANPVFHERTKHIEIDCHFIRDKIKAKVINTVHVHTQQQLADLLTKGLNRTQHSYLLGKLGVLNILHPSAWGGMLKSIC